MPVDPSMPVFPPSQGGDILATWGDAVSEHAVHRFVNVVDRDSKWANPPKGALCVTVDTLALWQYDGTNWVSVLPPRIYHGALAVEYRGDKAAAADLSFCPGQGTPSPGYIGPLNDSFPFPVIVFATAVELTRRGTSTTTGVTHDIAVYHDGSLHGSTGVNVFTNAAAHNSATHRAAYRVPANQQWGFKTRLVFGAAECWSEANFVIVEDV